MKASQPAARLTAEEYLELERLTDGKHEYIDGEMVAMAGGTPSHSMIGGNVYYALRRQLSNSSCMPFNSDLRVCVSKARLITYPDVTVACKPVLLTDEKRDTITNPRVVIEVLSPSTSNYDRGFKTMLYRICPSVEEYLLIDQTPVEIEHGMRLSDRQWKVEMITDHVAVIELKSINCSLSAAEVYADLDILE